MKKYIFLSVVYISLFLILISFISTHVSAQKENAGKYISGQILVKFKNSTSQEVIDTQTKIYNAKVINKLKKLNVLVLKVPQGAEERIVTALSKNPNIEYAELDYIAESTATVNDPDFSKQWGLENSNDFDIDAPEAWNLASGSGVVVAILDTGISQNHPDVFPQVLSWVNFSNSSSNNDINGHGTHVSGIVSALTNNNRGIAGVCPDCRLRSVKVLNDTGQGAYSWIAQGIIYAAENEAKVINMSLGGSSPSKTLEKAVNYAWRENVVLVAAAGNSGNQSKSYPAAYVNTIAVAATDNQDNKASFSEYGNWVDVAAPGASIYSAWNDNTSDYDPQPECNSASECYKYASGTSMAAPMTSAVAALIWSTGRYATASEVRNRLELTADPILGTGIYWSSGRINAFKAVDPQILISPTPTPTPKSKGQSGGHNK